MLNFHSTFSRVLLCCILTAFYACDDDQPVSDPLSLNDMGGSSVATQGLLKVNQPVQGQFFNTKEIVISGEHASASEVLVNGEMVPVVNQAFSTTLTFEEGPHRITVSAGEDQIEIDLLVDLTAPQVLITDPSYGTHLDSSTDSIVTMIGSVLDGDSGSGVESILINGQEVFIEANGRFVYSYAPEFGLNRPLVIARDRAGNESTATRGFLYGRYKQWGLPIERGIRGEMKPEAFDVIAVTIENALKSGVVDQLLQEAMGFSEDISIDEILFQDIDVQLIPANGHINVSISFFDLKIFFELNTPSTSGDVYISPARLDAQLTLAPNPDGSLNAQLINPSLHLDNLNIRVDNTLLDTAISFIEDYIRNLAEETLLSALEEALLEQLISPNLFSPLLEILGIEVRVSALFKQINVTQESVQVDLGVQISDLPSINNSAGYLHLPAQEVPPRLNHMASADISQNMLYLIFSHLWYGGLLNVTLAEIIDPPSTLSAALLNGFTDGKLVEYMSPIELIGVRLRPMLPPISRFDLTRPNAVIVDLVDLMIDLTLPDGQTWFTIGLDITSTIIPRLTDNRLGLEVELNVAGVKVDEPLFPVRSKELIPLLVNLIQNLPSQLGDEGLRNLFDLNEVDFYGLSINSGTLQGVEVPAPYLQVGIDLGTMIQ